MSDKNSFFNSSVACPANTAVSRLGRIVVLIFALDLALSLIYLVNFFFPIPSGMYTRLVDIDGESSIANWYSSMKLFLIGGLFLLFAWEELERKRPASWMLLVFPIAFWGMSADEVVQVHEWLGWKSDILLSGGTREGTFFQVTGIWMFVIAVPFFALFFALFFSMRRYFYPGSGSLSRILVGFGIFLGGAAGVEVLTNFVPDSGSLGFHLQVFAEELLEMWGASMILWGGMLLLFRQFSSGLQSKQSRSREVLDPIPRHPHHLKMTSRKHGKNVRTEAISGVESASKANR